MILRRCAAALLSFSVSVVTVVPVAADTPVPVATRTAPPTAPKAITPAGGWTARHDISHPLVGRLWDTGRGRFIDESTLVARLTRARYILLGEKHDNPDHHRLQARLITALAAQGRRPTVAMEMLDTSQETALTAYLRDNPQDAAGLGTAVGWENTGWPAWEFYQPIAEAALEAGLPLATANLTDDAVRAVARQGAAALPVPLRRALDLPSPIPEPVRGLLRRSVVEGHCGMLPESMAEPMIRVQAVRDALMAHALIQGARRTGTDGAVLIAGNGHVRRDAGVPWHLRRLGAEDGVVSVGFLEVATGLVEPAAYGERHGVEQPPFDVVWFTPVVDTADPCEKFRDQLERAGRRHGGSRTGD